MESKWASKVGSVVGRIAAPRFVFLAVAGLSCGWIGAVASAQPVSPASATTASLRRRVLRNYARLPLSFEPNVGQSNPDVKFLSRGESYGLFLTADRAVLLVREPSLKPAAGANFRAVSLQLLGSNPTAQVAASNRLPGVSNYLLGANPSQWHRGVPHYARVHYHDVYPGVDLVYYGRRQQLEYDFVVAPRADPSPIHMQVHGAQAISLNDHGDLVLQLSGSAVQLRCPQAYQEIGNKKRLVKARYVLEAGNRVAFALASYDRKRTLLIDPQLAYFTYLGGTGDETSPAVAVDSAFSAYVAGTTTSATDFPTTASAFQTIRKGNTSNVFVSKFNSQGTALLFSTYLGGTGTDSAGGIAVDRGFNPYVTGTTSSVDFPITSASAVPDSPAAAGTNHVFVTRLNASGTGLVYSTYLAGNGVDTASGVAVGPLADTVFVTGTTTSSNFATVTKLNGRDASQFFVTELNTARQKGASLLYSTYIGGTAPASALTDGGGIAVDSAGDAYVTGGTTYTDMPVANAPTFPGGTSGAKLNGVENAFVAKLNPNGVLPALFLTYLGGSQTDVGRSVAVDSGGNAYVTGSTDSPDFPVLAATGSSIYQGTFAGTGDAFVTKLASNGSSLIWSTYIGQSGDTRGLGIAVDANQNTFVTGSTSGTLTTVKPTQAANNGGATDAFVGEFDVSGTAEFVTFLGGGGDDHGTGIALDVDGNPYVAGDTTSTTGLPMIGGASQPALKGGIDAFVAHFRGQTTLALTAAASPNPVGIGNPVAFAFTVTNQGPDIATAIVLTDTILPGGTFQSVSASQGTCSAPAGSTLACSLGQLVVNASATVIVHIASSTVGPLSNTASVSSGSTNGNMFVGASAAVNDFSVAVSPSTASTPAGQAATYTVTVGPVPQGAAFPNGVSLKCSAGVPTAAMCAFTTNPLTPNASPRTSSLTISTTALPPGTTAALSGRNLRPIYAVMLPLGGIAFFGFSVSGAGRRRRLAGILVLLVILGLTLLQPACGSSSKKPTPPAFTPAGTYKITVAAISGTVTHSTTLTMVVQ